MEIKENWKPVYIKPEDFRYWPKIREAYNSPDMQYESTNGEPAFKRVLYKGIKNPPIFLVVVEFQSENQSMINVFEILS